ncbi:tetratricopeptide repeat-containing sensor histidine kinase [Tenacibaculum geojense]|uniref:histidine kinase n=1 Tax=Tenacibaculum geojense TaxID=915352 RepID=A0ABW3JT96_9FLAO
MINKIKYSKILVPLIFVFLFSQARAESLDSAFSAIIQVDTSNIKYKKYTIGKKLYQSGEYSKSLKYLLDAINTEKSSSFYNAEIYSLIAGIYFESENYNESINYFKRSLGCFNNNFVDKQITDEDAVLRGNVYLKLSAAYYKINIKDSSIYFLKKIISNNQINTKYRKIEGNAYGNLAAIYISSDSESELVINYLTKAIEIHKQVNNLSSLAASYSNLATIHVKNKDYLKAKYFYNKALEILEDKNDKQSVEYKESLYDNMAWSLYNLKDYTAYEYVTKSYSIRDSLNEKKLKADIKKIQLRHNIDLVKKAEENKRLRLERNNWIIGVVGILVSLLFLYIANLYKLKQKNLRLKLSENELEQQRKLEKLKSDSQAKIINAAIDGKETERKQIAEILHDNVSALLSSANMHLQATQKQFKGDEVPIEIQKSQQIILEASQKIRELSHNLVSSVLLKFGLEYAIKDAAKKYSNSSLRFFTAISNVNRYAQEYEIKIFNIVQELINNILKHSKAEKAYIAMEEEDSMLTIMVKDDGKGFDTNKSKDGIGLNQIRARVDMLNGSFEIESAKNIGTKIIIKVPVVRNQVPKSA